MSVTTFTGSPNFAFISSPNFARGNESRRVFLSGVRLSGSRFGTNGIRTINIAQNPGFLDYIFAELDAIPFPEPLSPGDRITINRYAFTHQNDVNGVVTNPDIAFVESFVGGTINPALYIEPPEYPPPSEFAWAECSSDFSSSVTHIGFFEIYKIRLEGPTRFPACISRNEAAGRSCDNSRVTEAGSGPLWTHDSTATTLKPIRPTIAELTTGPFLPSGFKAWRSVLRVDVRQTDTIATCCNIAP